MVPLLLGLIAFLAAWNNAINVLPRPAWLYVPVNLTVGAAFVALARRSGLGRRQLGLGGDEAGAGIRWGGGVAVLVGAGLAVMVTVPGLRHLLADERLAGMGLVEVSYRVLIRIPLGTALFEEVAFRSVLLGVWARQRGTKEAVIGSSALFGLWHVVPTMQALEVNAPDAGPAAVAAGVAGGVVVTAVAGLGFCLLRLRSGSVIAPVIAHAAINSLATVASVAADRLG
jgi:uncharacterized protein